MKEETAKSTTATIKTANPVWKLCGSKQTNGANCGVYCHIQRRMHGAEHTIVPTSHCYPTFIWCLHAVWQRVWVWVCGARVHCELFFELLLFVDSVTVVCCCLLLLLMLLLLVGARSCCVCERARVCVCVYVCVFFVLSVLLIADTLPSSSNFYFDQYTCSSSNSSWHCYIGCICVSVSVSVSVRVSFVHTTRKKEASTAAAAAAFTRTADIPSRLTSAACFIDVLFCCTVFQYHQISRPIRIDFRSKLRASSQFQRFWKKK